MCLPTTTLEDDDDKKKASSICVQKKKNHLRRLISQKKRQNSGNVKLHPPRLPFFFVAVSVFRFFLFLPPLGSKILDEETTGRTGKNPSNNSCKQLPSQPSGIQGVNFFLQKSRKILYYFHKIYVKYWRTICKVKCGLKMLIGWHPVVQHSREQGQKNKEAHTKKKRRHFRVCQLQTFCFPLLLLLRLSSHQDFLFLSHTHIINFYFEVLVIPQGNKTWPHLSLPLPNIFQWNLVNLEVCKSAIQWNSDSHDCVNWESFYTTQFVCCYTNLLG